MIKIILTYLLLITQAFPQAGSVQTTEAGITNYQVQSVEPTTTPVAGKKYLYNKNSQYKTKDSAGRYSRAFFNQDNLLQRNNNSDAEEGLTADFTYTAATTILNTTTPLAGLNSLDFNPTNNGEFLDTAFITLPRGLYGQTCMAQFTYIGGDSNLSGYVYNRDNEIVGQIALSAVTNSTTITIPFTCPTQANVTADPDKADVKIRIAQSTATNAAVATVDDFYIGVLNTNKIGVQGASQWYYYTANADINGNFPFPAPTDSINDKTLFTYAGTTLTVLKPSKIDISINATASLAVGVDISAQLNCTISGVSRVVNNVAFKVGNQSSSGYTSPLLVSGGDSCVISINRVSGTYASYGVNITATPIPQIATVLDTGVPPAGFLGKVVYSDAGCIWSRTSTTMGAFAALPACATNITREGFAVADTVTPGQLPSVTISTLPKARIKVAATGLFYKGNAQSGTCSYNLALNGVVVAQPSGLNITSANQIGDATKYFEFSNPSLLNNAKLEIYAASDVGGGVCNLLAANAITYKTTIIVSSEPDLSTPYALNQQIAVLPAQVTNSSEKRWRVESCVISGGGASSCTTWLTSSSRTALGVFQANITSGIFSSTPFCWCAISDSTDQRICTPRSVTTTTLIYTTMQTAAAGVYQDHGTTIFCQGFTN
jgi:hypothetical protein